MMVFDMSTTRRVISPWGAEVKKRLVDRRLRQDDLVCMLQNQGFDIDKGALSNLLYGIGITNRQSEIERISQYLDIPYHS